MESSYICPSLPWCCKIWALPIFCQWTNYAKIPMEVDTQWFRKSELGQIPKHTGLWLLCEWVGVSGHSDPPPSKGCFPAEQSAHQLLALVVFTYHESLICPDLAIGYAFAFQLALPTSIIYLIWYLACVLMSVSLLKYFWSIQSDDFSIVHVSYVMGTAVSLELYPGWHWQAFTQRPQESVSCWRAPCWPLLASNCCTQGTVTLIHWRWKAL